ncbi:MAG: hypothetical protein Q7R33_01080 [Nitrosarchaeum sp.]|nr:hypothetical protein [Nitrosarchaeum sp.]
MKLLTRQEKRNPEIMQRYQKYVDEGIKPQRAAERAKEEVERIQQKKR